MSSSKMRAIRMASFVLPALALMGFTQTDSPVTYRFAIFNDSHASVRLEQTPGSSICTQKTLPAITIRSGSHWNGEIVIDPPDGSCWSVWGKSEFASGVRSPDGFLALKFVKVAAKRWRAEAGEREGHLQYLFTGVEHPNEQNVLQISGG